MRLVYLTSKRYPATTADHFFVKAMADAFLQILGKDFLFLTATMAKAPRHFRLLYYFFWIPFFIIKNKCGRETVLFSNDAYLLAICIFWKKIFRLEYKICSDWHQLFNDWRDRFVSRHSDFLITTSQNLKNLILDLSPVKEEKILVSYGGVDLDIFDSKEKSTDEIRRNLGLLESDFLVGYVGFYKTMGMDKGLDTMMGAIEFIADKNIKMVFVGGKNTEIAEYKSQAKKLGVEERIMFVPVVPNSQIPSYERTLDVLVIPYPDKPHFRDYGFPMKVYEYMASDKPIIYSDLEIIGEVLKDCAIAFQPDESKDLARKIEYIKENPEIGVEFALKATVRVRDYTWLKRAENIVNFFRRSS